MKQGSERVVSCAFRRAQFINKILFAHISQRFPKGRMMLPCCCCSLKYFWCISSIEDLSNPDKSSNNLKEWYAYLIIDSIESSSFLITVVASYHCRLYKYKEFPSSRNSWPCLISWWRLEKAFSHRSFNSYKRLFISSSFFLWIFSFIQVEKSFTALTSVLHLSVLLPDWSILHSRIIICSYGPRPQDGVHNYVMVASRGHAQKM